MFSSLKKQQITISFLILSFLYLFSLLNRESNNINSFQELQKEMLIGSSLSKIIHELQKERGISSGYLASQGGVFKYILKEQRILTDKAIANSYRKKLNINKKQLLDREKLLRQRNKIDSLSVSVKESLVFYSGLNDKLLQEITDIAKVSKIPQITQLILAHSNFLYLKENTGIERAIGTAILSDKTFLKSNTIEFIKLIAMQELYLKKFNTYASENFILYYKNTMRFPEFKLLGHIKDRIVNAESYQDLGISPKFWLQNMTIKVDKLKQISHYIEKKIGTDIKKDYTESYNRYLLYFFLTITLGIVLLLIVMIFIRDIQKERRKRLLLEKYVINSTTDLHGNITYVSEAFCKITGYTEQELIGKPHNIVRHPETPKSTFREIWTTIQNKKIWTGRIKNLKKDGSFYWVYATIEPLLDTKGIVEGYAAVRIDITNSIALEEKIVKEVEKNRQKDQTMLHQSKLAQMGEMISMIAHQWRQPLSAISATSGSLSLKSQIGTLDKETTIELADKITEYSQHLSTTIDDFRNFFKENKKKEISTFQEMVLSTLTIVELSLENAKIEIELNVKSSTELETYINEVKQVILNIIKNAEDILIEKAVENPKIAIDIKEDTLTISDNAGGIPEEIMEKIFEPYFSTKMQKDGTGLGLYMSKTIIEEHCDGKLSVYNSKEGAVFIINLSKKKELNNDK